MNLYISSDHAGFKLKEAVKEFLKNSNTEFQDLGTFSEESTDWPKWGAAAAARVSESPDDSRAIIICGSGLGMSMVSNKFRNVRAALCTSPLFAEMSRKHNNANVLNLGERFTTVDTALEIVKTWLNTPFEGDRHARRLDMLAEYEAKNFK